MFLIKRSIEVKENFSNIGFDKDYYVLNFFFENLIRIYKLFEMVEFKLGLKIIEFNVDISFVNKGEIFYDIILIMSVLGLDVCVIRYFDIDYYKELIVSLNIYLVIVNGGDGLG